MNPNTRTEIILVANVQWCRNDTRTLLEKMYLISKTAEEINKLTKRFGILIAPEYFWGREGSLTTENYEYIIQALKELSKKHKNIMFIPGTVLWSEKILPDNIEKTKQYLKLNSSHASVPPFDLNKSVSRIKEGNFIVRNTALVVYWSYDTDDGNTLQQKVFEYHKKSNYHEVPASIKNKVFFPGCVDGLFNWCISERGQASLKIGIEICFDNNQSVAINDIEANNHINTYMLNPNITAGGEKRDIHIVLSDFVVPRNIKQLVENRGIFLHSSTVFKFNNDLVVRPYTNKPTIIKTKDNDGNTYETISETSVDFYCITVNF